MHTKPRRLPKRARSWAIPTVLCLMSAAGAAQPCGPAEICGLKNPEDMVRLDGTRWAVVSRLGRDPNAAGGFSLIDLKTQTARVLMPDVSRAAAPMYSKCPSPPKATDLVTHGLDVRRTATGHQVFAVNHGGRESIEVFDLQVGESARLTWTGCVMLPPEFSANAVAALPDGLAVTSFGTAGAAGTLELLAGNPRGFVGHWTEKQGWLHVPGSDFGGDNGVTASRDGSVIYVNDWNDGTLRVVPLTPGREPVTIQLGHFHPDNVHWMAGGNLLIAGQIGSARDVLRCASSASCSIASKIVVLDARHQQIRSENEVAASADFGAASTALFYRGHYWLSSFRGDRIIQTDLPTH
jgi:hypothetical protein